MKLKELIDQRKGLVNKIDALVKTADTEKRELTDAENTEFDNLSNQVGDLDIKIERQRSIDAMSARTAANETHLNSIPGPRLVADPGNEANLSQGEQRDVNEFSYVKYLREMYQASNGSGPGLTGLEREMHQQSLVDARNEGRAVEGVGIPQLVLAQSRINGGGAGRFRNDLTAETSTGGVETVQTTVGSVIDILHERLLVRQMGATFLTGLVGNISFPAPVKGTDPAHKGENAASDETSPTFGTVTLAPERLPVYIEVSEQLLLQSSMAVETWVRTYLATRLGIIIDKMAINGSGSSNQPTGILQTSGIGSVVAATGTPGGTPTYVDMVNLETEVAKDDADMGSLGYVTTPEVRGVLKQTQVFSGTNGAPVWTGSVTNAEVNGYRAMASNVVPSNLTDGSYTGLHAVIYGNWAELLVGQWGGINLRSNPYIKDDQGLVRIMATAYYDIAVRHAASFAAMKDVTLT